MSASETASAFSSSETAALDRPVDLEDLPIQIEQIWNENNQKIVIGWIKQNTYKRICLQFPDSYLIYSNAISDSIKSGINLPDLKVFILADTSYGSCCVDEIAAAHTDADSLIHFGNACRSKVTRLPVLYVFPHFSFDLPAFYQELASLSDTINDQKIWLYLDIGYHHLLDHQNDDDKEYVLYNKLKEIWNFKQLHIIAYPTAKDDDKCADECQSLSAIEEQERMCIFVGSDNERFFNLSLTTKATKWFIYDPSNKTLVEKNPLTANYIRRRYFYIEKCKDAQTLGLIVATLTSDGYLDVVARLQEMAKSRGIKAQIISVGRINPAKLANFLEIDCFVLIGCPFNNLYTSKEFYKPIVSVFEAEMALNPAWHMKYPESYVTDFKQILPEGRSFLPFEVDKIQEQDVSLVSGRLRSNANENDVEICNSSALSEQQQIIATQSKMEVMTTNVGLTFEDRTWKGLDPALGQTEPAKLQKGLSGIPISYVHD